jgi:hypothetical protein
MPEMPLACEHHGKARVIGGFDNLVIAQRSARLDDCRGPCLGSGDQPIGKGKERI